VDCSKRGDSSLCYVILPSVVVPIHKVLLAIPHPIDLILRTLLLMIPKKLAPATKPYSAIMIVDPEDGNKPVQLIQDPTGKDTSMLTGVTIHDNKLYLGSLHNSYIGVYDLN